jgi:hypothetical protein
MYPSRFAYEAPKTLAEAIALLDANGGEAKVLSGGQSLIPMVKLRFASPELLVDINNIPGLDYMRIDEQGNLRIGALVRHEDLEHSTTLPATHPTLAAAAHLVADPIVRTRGTFVGSLCHADPQGDWAATMIALGGRIVAQGPKGKREIDMREFVLGPFTNALAFNEIAVEAIVPPVKGKAAYLEALNEIVGREGVDLVVPVSEETMHVAHLAGMLPAGVRLFTMPPSEVLALHDKASFVRKAAAMGLSVPGSAPLGSAEAEALARSGPVVVKPVFSCSGNGLSILRGSEPLPPADSAQPMVVQRFLEGREHSTCTIAQKGRVVATMVYRGALMSGSVAVAFERVEVPAITTWIERFVAETGWSGFIAFDFIVDAAGVPHAIECNPRATSGVHFWEPDDIARAVLEPHGSAPVRVRPQRRLQQFYACLTETQGAMLRRKGFLPALRSLVTTRDVSWDRRDPWPFLSMIGTSWPIIWQSITKGARFGEVATADVGWYQN